MLERARLFSSVSLRWSVGTGNCWVLDLSADGKNHGTRELLTADLDRQVSESGRAFVV